MTYVIYSKTGCPQCETAKNFAKLVVLTML